MGLRLFKKKKGLRNKHESEHIQIIGTDQLLLYKSDLGLITMSHTVHIKLTRLQDNDVMMERVFAIIRSHHDNNRSLK